MRYLLILLICLLLFGCATVKPRPAIDTEEYVCMQQDTLLEFFQACIEIKQALDECMAGRMEAGR